MITVIFFFFNDPSTTEIYTLSLHDALPIYLRERLDHQLAFPGPVVCAVPVLQGATAADPEMRTDRRNPLRTDRKSTRLNSSHVEISYAVFCLKKKKNKKKY